MLVHVVLESLAAVDEDNGDFVIVEVTDLGVGVYVDFAPREAAAPLEFDEALLDDFAEMTSPARIQDDFAGLQHATECSSIGARFPRHEGA